MSLTFTLPLDVLVRPMDKKGIILYTIKQKSSGTIRKARCLSLNNLWRVSIKMGMVSPVRQVDNISTE